jgi:hypothetical protein
MLPRMWRKENVYTLLVGLQIGEAITEKSIDAPKQIKNRTTYDPSNLSVFIPPKKWNHYQIMIKALSYSL